MSHPFDSLTLKEIESLRKVTKNLPDQKESPIRYSALVKLRPILNKEKERRKPYEFLRAVPVDFLKDVLSGDFSKYRDHIEREIGDSECCNTEAPKTLVVEEERGLLRAKMNPYGISSDDYVHWLFGWDDNCENATSVSLCKIDAYKKGWECYSQLRRHAAHCCREHGCKYIYEKCPVVGGMLRQKYPCEDCSTEGD